LLDRLGALGVLAESHAACRRRASKLSARFFTVESQTLLARQVRRDVLLPRCTNRILLLETRAARYPPVASPGSAKNHTRAGEKLPRAQRHAAGRWPNQTKV
jgi:hypothetical protein